MLTHQQSRVESHESCRVRILVAASFIFVSRTPEIGREGCYYVLGSECGVLYWCTVQSVIKTYCIRADLIGLDSVGVHPSRLLESDWTRLDSTLLVGTHYKDDVTSRIFLGVLSVA
jgi:hypothetical protein